MRQKKNMNLTICLVQFLQNYVYSPSLPVIKDQLFWGTLHFSGRFMQVSL